MQTIETLKHKQDVILALWQHKQTNDIFANGHSFDQGDSELYSQQIFESFVSSLSESNLDDVHGADFEQVIHLLREVALKRARMGYSPRETANLVFTLKESIFEVLIQESSDNDLVNASVLAIGRLLDNMAVHTFETFIEGREEVIMRQTDEITEISTPVIKVWDGILALPIIGTLDSARTQTVLESLLQEIVETGSSIAILDISGVPTVDSLVAQHLIKAVSATRLMGADCIISGIRPEIAQTIVHLGIDLSQIVTKATLASALQHAFRSLALEVRKADVGRQNRGL